ncbi:X8 domain [Sesbania bispinosa]|nr:X8 domain [Sesbania bispinosa]
MGRGIVVAREVRCTAIPVTTFFTTRREHYISLMAQHGVVALAGVPQADLQNALDWAVGLGMAGLHSYPKGGPCFEPDTIVSHASFAFNNYYQTNGNSDIACNFGGGTASLTKRDPSYGNVSILHLDLLNSSAPSSLRKHNQRFMWLKTYCSATGFILLDVTMVG